MHMGEAQLKLPEDKKEVKTVKTLNVFVLLLAILLIATVLTHIIPSGEYDKVEKEGRDIVNPKSFEFVDSSPVDFFGFFTAIHTGLVEAADIIFFVLIIGGTFGILTKSGTIEALMIFMAKKLANKDKWLVPIMMLFFAIGGSLIGMSEEALIYVPILVPLAVALGFDVLTGAAIVLIGASVGFTTAVMNPFTVGIAQGIAGLPLFSGIAYRIVLFVVIYGVAVAFVYRHAMKVKKNPSLGFFGKYKRDGKNDFIHSDVKLEKRHKWILAYFLFNFVVLAYGVIKYQWYITEISALFILLAIVVGILGRLSADKMVDSFMKGSSDLIAAALIIGVSKATLVVLSEGQIIDTMLYHASNVLQQLPSTLNVIGMFLFQSIIHFIIPSGSGQAALTMPIMAPLADLVGVTRQTTVLSFSMAYGVGSIIFPTVGYFMAALSLAGIPWGVWAKWILPLVLLEYGIGLIAVVIAHFIGYGPF